ncbi:uncharacterized protein LOC112597903, partial [Melanaphis sacchari]|uniref:uncharacterized protein LOC112597903 n=1 Tax=Melanaphis sacchari TaxID=742174 RepID=UPI000DC134B0
MKSTATVMAVAKMIEAGVFGSDSRFLSFTLDGQHNAIDQFASSILYGTITVGDCDCHQRSYRLVFKFKYTVPEVRELIKNDKQFHNETLFYERILPFLMDCCSQKDDDEATIPTLCRYFYGRNDCGDLVNQDIVVLENDAVRGYRMAVTDHRLCLDFDHLVVAIRALAKFHGLSYRAKHVDRKTFEDLVAEVQETQWDDNGRWGLLDKEVGGLLAVALDRIIERRGGGGGDVDRRVHRFRTELLADASDTLRRVMEPTEPLSVLCHGDFNRNNLMFRYDDGGGGRPVDALPYDMATVRYGSPALDLSFFLYMNTDRRTRDDHWDALLDAYCGTLAAVAGDVPVPDRRRLDAEMREHAFYGLA